MGIVRLNSPLYLKLLRPLVQHMLWHQRLVHISIERMKRLVNEGVLRALDFADFETCVACSKGN